MNGQDFNNNFFSYQGVINRKNYIINMLILIGMFIALKFVNFNAFMQFSKFQFIGTILSFVVGLFQFVIFFSILSTIYRRISDISYNKAQDVKSNYIKAFGIIYVLPVLYFLCLRYFFDIVPFFLGILDLIMFYIFIPLALIFAIFLAFKKRV